MTKKDTWESILSRQGIQIKKQVDSRLQRVIQVFLHRHFEQLTGIQSEAIPALYSGHNGILMSATASGKTEAAVIPVIARIIGDKNKPVCVYLAPTKALLNDLHRRLEVPLHRLGIKLAIRHGDRSLKSGDEELSLLLTTPESLDVLLTKDHPFFKKVRFVICDEIHQVLGTPRGQQLIFLVERIEQRVEGDLQRIALSATLGNPATASSWLDPSSKPVEIFKTRSSKETTPEIWWLERKDYLKQIMGKNRVNKVIVFTNSRRTCDDIFLSLKNFDIYQTYIHYSTLPRNQREYVETQFKKAEYAICVATSTLELGVDIGSVEKILLYEPPFSVMSFLQRGGRGGRRKTQSPVIMTPKNERELITFCALYSLAAENLVEDVPPGCFYSVVIQQIFSYLAGKRNYRMHVSEVMELFKSFAWIETDDITTILSNLAKKRYIVAEPAWSSYVMGPNLRSLVNDAEIHSNIGNGNTGIAIFYRGRRIASLPITSNQARIGSEILYAGRYWRITSIGDRHLSVTPVSSSSSPIRPAYRGSSTPPISSLVANRIRDTLLGKSLISKGLDKLSSQHLSEIINNVPNGASDNSIFEWKRRHEDDIDYYYYTFAGGLENIILCLLLSEHGYDCRPAKGSEGLIIQSRERLDKELIPLDTESIRQIVEKNWKIFSSAVFTGPFAELLPNSLLKKEILSQVLYGSILSHVSAFHNASVVDIQKPLWSN